MYIYKNISGGAVNVRGIAFGKGGEIKSDVIIGGFQDAIDCGILSLVDTLATQSKDAKQSAAVGNESGSIKADEVKRVPRKYTRREKKVVQEAPEAKTEASGNTGDTGATIVNASAVNAADAAATDAGNGGAGGAVQ